MTFYLAVKVAMNTSSAKFVTINELRVFELKQELEKRGLDKSGIKLALVERLEAALREEGHDPKTHTFLVGEFGKTLSSRTSFTKENSSEESNEIVEEEREFDAENTILEKENDKEIADLSLSSDFISMEMKEEKVEEKIPVASPDLLITDVEMLDDQSKEIVDDKSIETKLLVDVKKSEEKEVETDEKIMKNRSNEKNSSNVASTANVQTVESTPVDTSTVAHPQCSARKEKFAENSLWIKGISPTTKAADLKAIFSKFGRVITAKIFTRRQQPSSTCFGFVTMIDAAAADLCVQKLHKTTVNGRIIVVERADRSTMPVVKSISKKNTLTSVPVAAKESATDSETANVKKTSTGEQKTLTEKPVKKEKESLYKENEKRISSNSVIEKEKSAAGSGRSSLKRDSETVLKKTPVKGPVTNETKPSESKTTVYKKQVPAFRSPPVYRSGRRVFERIEPSFKTRKITTAASRKPSYISSALRRSGHAGRSYMLSRSMRGNTYASARREVSSRRVEPTPSWEKREMMDLIRRKEEEHRLKEQELRLQRERERLKFERERIERERLELQQLRMASLAVPPVPIVSASRRSHETYDDTGATSRRHGEHIRTSGGERVSSSSHRSVNSLSRSSTSDRRESRRIATSHHSSRSSASDRDRDRSRHSGRSREYSSSVRTSTRDSHNYGRSAEPSTTGSNYERDLMYRGDSAYGSGSSHRETTYTSRELNYGSYNRDAIPSAYSKEIGYGSTSRSVGTSSWASNSGNASSPYVGASNRDYGSDSAWVPSISSQAHNISSGSWPSRVDSWNGGNYSSQDTHASNYDKYDSYDKYSRRY